MIRDEIQHVSLGNTIDYSGIFSLPDLLMFIEQFFRSHSYEKEVTAHKETVSKTGRNINMKLRPFKRVKSNKLEIQLKLNVSNLKDVIKKLDGIKVNMNEGHVNIVIDSFVIKNIRGSFDARPEYIVIKTFFDKFLFSSKPKDYEGQVEKDATELYNELKSFLHLNKYLF